MLLKQAYASEYGMYPELSENHQTIDYGMLNIRVLRQFEDANNKLCYFRIPVWRPNSLITFVPKSAKVYVLCF